MNGGGHVDRLVSMAGSLALRPAHHRLDAKLFQQPQVHFEIAIGFT